MSASSERHSDLMVVIVATILGIAFGKFAQDISGWIACWNVERTELGTFAGCNLQSRVTAILIAALVSTMVAIIGACLTVLAKGGSDHDLAIGVAGFLTGGFFAILKAAAKDAPYPQFELLYKPLYMFVVVAAMFTLPFLILRWKNLTANGLFLRIAIATIFGAVLGAIAMMFTEWLSELMDWGAVGASELRIAPMATVAGASAWGTVLLDPWLRRKDWKRSAAHRAGWVVVFGFAAILLAFAYGALIYYWDMQNDAWAVRGWIDKKGVSHIEMGLYDVALLLPGLLAFSIVVIHLHGDNLIRSAIIGGGAGAVLGALAAWWVALDAVPPDASTVAFCTGHAIAAALVGATIILGHCISGKIERRLKAKAQAIQQEQLKQHDLK